MCCVDTDRLLKSLMTSYLPHEHLVMYSDLCFDKHRIFSGVYPYFSSELSPFEKVDGVRYTTFLPFIMDFYSYHLS